MGACTHFGCTTVLRHARCKHAYLLHSRLAPTSPPHTHTQRDLESVDAKTAEVTAKLEHESAKLQAYGGELDAVDAAFTSAAPRAHTRAPPPPTPPFAAAAGCAPARHARLHSCTAAAFAVYACRSAAWARQPPHPPTHPPTPCPGADANCAAIQKELDSAQAQFKEFELKDTKVRGWYALTPAACALRSTPHHRDTPRPRHTPGSAKPVPYECPSPLAGRQVRTDLKHLKARQKKALAKQEADASDAAVRAAQLWRGSSGGAARGRPAGAPRRRWRMGQRARARARAPAPVHTSFLPDCGSHAIDCGSPCTGATD